MKKDTRERFTLRVPTQLFQLLQAEAAETGFSTNSYILKILWDWKEKQENEEKG